MTLVIDASAFTGLVIGSSSPVLADHAAANGHWLAPEHFTIEVVSALRGAWLDGTLTDTTFPVAVQRLADAGVQTWPVRPLLPRVVELAANASVYDAASVALAEHLDVPLLTDDRRLSRVPGIRCWFLL